MPIVPPPLPSSNVRVVQNQLAPSSVPQLGPAQTGGIDVTGFFLLMMVGAVFYWLFKKLKELKRSEGMAKFGS